jgi:hypothetical protein
MAVENLRLGRSRIKLFESTTRPPETGRPKELFLKKHAIRALVFALLALGFGSCTFISDKSGEIWKGDDIEFDVGYSFPDAGYFIGFHPIYVPIGTASTAPYSPSESAFVSQMGANNSFTKEFQYNGATLTVSGTFTSRSSCSGKTDYQGNSLNWTATVVQE